jgi:hypothetical protein
MHKQSSKLRDEKLKMSHKEWAGSVTILTSNDDTEESFLMSCCLFCKNKTKFFL